jgi:flavin-binding protein dodecin
MPVTKVIEVIGSSTESSDDAVQQALLAASRSIRGIRRIEVLSTSCEVADGQIDRWEVLVKIHFPVEARDEAVASSPEGPMKRPNAN